MRINEKKESGGVARKEKKERPKGGSVTGALFAGRLTQAQQSSDYAGELERLKGEIDLAGERLEHEPTIVNFRRFRELIGALAKKVSSEAYRVELLGGSGGGRLHEVISVIDKEADLLYHLVMREQKDHIRIAAQIIKIRGLVVDIIL